MNNIKEKNISTSIITPEIMLEHWQGHRRLTRNVIIAFPEDKLFKYSIGGMRPFADMAKELIGIAGMGIHGIANDDWNAGSELNYNSENSPLSKTRTRKELLNFWDQATEIINTLWPQIPKERFSETALAFGQYEAKIWWHLFYFIDNENHHRGQGYVYLRSLGIKPPYFWERD